MNGSTQLSRRSVLALAGAGVAGCTPSLPAAMVPSAIDPPPHSFSVKGWAPATRAGRGGRSSA